MIRANIFLNIMLEYDLFQKIEPALREAMHCNNENKRQAAYYATELYKGNFVRIIRGVPAKDDGYLPSVVRIAALSGEEIKGVNVVFSPRTSKEARVLSRWLAREVEKMADSILSIPSKEFFKEIMQKDRWQVLAALELRRNKDGKNSLGMLYPGLIFNTILKNSYDGRDREKNAIEIMHNAGVLFLKSASFSTERVILGRFDNVVI